MNLELNTDTKFTLLCDCYSVTDIADNVDILQAWRSLKSEYPGHSFLFILDDFRQACYTSMHAIDFNGLDDTDGQDLSQLPIRCFEGGKHRGYLSTPEELPIRIAAFMRGASEITLQDVAKRGISLVSEYAGRADPFKGSDNLLSVMEKPCRMFKIPLVYGYETVMAFPNGYFDGDLSPFENYVLAKHLEEQYGYILIGMGASLLAFAKTRQLDESGEERLMSMLQTIYRDNDLNIEHQKMLVHIIKNKDILVLRYTE